MMITMADDNKDSDYMIDNITKDIDNLYKGGLSNQVLLLDDENRKYIRRQHPRYEGIFMLERKGSNILSLTHSFSLSLTLSYYL